jgi:uncharacterized Zn finger protein
MCEGMTRHPMKECENCGTVWFNDGTANHTVVEPSRMQESENEEDKTQLLASLPE